LLKDVLDAQALSSSDSAKIHRELQFPRTIQKAIDLDQLQRRSVSANPDNEAAAQLRARRWAALEAAPHQSGKRSTGKAISDRRVPFDVDVVDSMITTYRTEGRPSWLQPKKDNRSAAQAPDNKSRDLSMGMSKAKQDEMLAQMAINEATQKMDRAHALQRRFSKTCAKLKLQRVASDLSLNRMFLSSESAKLANLKPYFADKTLDPNLSVEKIETASPTQFFRMLHRTLPLQPFRPQPYPDIVHALTPDPEEPPPDLTRSPYLTYATKSGEKPYMHPSDHQKWGKIPINEVFDLSSGCSERNRPSGCSWKWCCDD